MASEERVGQLICPGYEELGIPPLYVHDLTGTEDADRLLSKPPVIHPATSKVLPNMRRWNPEIAAGFSEKENAVKRIPFKLVTKDRAWDSTLTRDFVAVSYCWHNDEWTVPSRFSYTPDDWSLPISPAMLRALLSLLGDDDAVWVDQLCIDQNDSEQKAHAIANMDTIYRNAFYVLVLLEDLDVSLDVEQALDLLASTPGEPEKIDTDFIYLSTSELEEKFPRCYSLGVIEPLFGFLDKVLDCRWFGRAWCCQEYQLNDIRAFVFVGRKYPCIAMPYRFFSVFRDALSSVQVNLFKRVKSLRLETFTFGIGRNAPEQTKELEMFQLFTELERLSCLLFQDIVSIALNTSGLFLSFNMEIKTKAQCQFILALVLLCAGNARVLDTVGPPIYKRRSPSYQGVMRWPTDSDYQRLFLPVRNHLSAGPMMRHVCMESLTLDLFCLHSQPRISRNESSATVKALRTGSHWLPPICDDDGIQALATVLDIDLSWMVLGEEGHEPVFRKLLDYGTRPLVDEDTSRRKVTKLADRIKDKEDLLLYLDIYFLYLERTIPFTMYLDKEGTRNAVIFIPRRLGQAIRNNRDRFVFTVPAALNNPAAIFLRRLWILEQTKPLEDTKTISSHLSIAGQGFYFGEDLTVDDKVTYEKDITVVGRWHEDVNEYDSADEWTNYPGGVPKLDIKWDAEGGRC